jgi:DNA-binding CsgD family transcriptional regulator
MEFRAAWVSVCHHFTAPPRLLVPPHRFARELVPPPRRVREQQLKSLAIELLCQTLPIGALALDARCRVLFANREAADLLARWNAAGGQGPGVKSFVRPVVPAEIVAACQRLRQGEARNNGDDDRPRFGGRWLVRHPKRPNLSAVVALERSVRNRKVAFYCVLVQDRLRDSLVAGRRDQLAMLTAAERRVAKLVAEGLRNREFAATLGRSITTVKSQLGAVFSKLQIGSRTQLATLLRSV